MSTMLVLNQHPGIDILLTLFELACSYLFIDGVVEYKNL
jgi:hypothetical protein